MSRRPLGLIEGALRLWARGRWRAETGSVSPIFALMLVPLLGGLGMAVETGNWYLAQRGMQNAADSAAIAAATNGTTGSPCATVGDYCYEAKAAASRMGYANGTNTTVTATYLTTGCPGTVTDCYRVAITKNVPLGLLKAVGYQGTTGVSVGGGAAQRIQVVSIARATGVGTQFCDIALGTGSPFTINGGPKVNFNGCSLFSNGDLTCNGTGSDTGVIYGYAAGTSTCGQHQLSGQSSMTDPFSYLSSKIPAYTSPCNKTPKNPTVVTSMPSSGLLQVCGDMQLGGPLPITAANSEIIIYNGGLLLNGQTLSTSGSGSVTIIFSGNNKGTTAEYPTGSGTIDIAAPNSGTFSGVAIMQDSGLSDSGGLLDMTYKGSNPTIKIQGLIYMPNGNFEVAGAIDMHTGGLSCVGVIALTLKVDGNGSFFDGDTLGPAAQCPQAGLILPTVPGSGARLGLIQ
jgi:Flp pilus assembly protein TadG